MVCPQLFDGLMETPSLIAPASPLLGVDMTSGISHHRLVIRRRWATLSSAALIGLTFVALLIWGNGASAAPPGILVPPSLPALAPASLAPATQVTSNTCPLDVVVVLDRSGSMEFNPVCLGCWERTETAGPHAGDTPPYSGYYTYPDNGVAYPLSITDTEIISACATSPPPSETYYDDGSYKYIIIEAELYSANNSVVDTNFWATGKGYWAIQRGERNYPNGSYPSTGTSVDEIGMHVAHHPDITFYPDTQPYGQFYTLGDAMSGNAPRLDYDFSFVPGEWGNGNAYVWVRVHAGRTVCCGLDPRDDNGITNRDTMYWQIEDLDDPGRSTAVYENREARADLDQPWTWVRLDDEPDVLNDKSHRYRLHIWAGSSGYSIDRIVITDNPSSSGNGGNGGALGNARTASVTAGSASRAACDPCNPIYGLTVGPGTSYPVCTFFSTPVTATNNLLDPIWGDEEAPMRGVKESVKRGIRQFDPRRDQVGLVSFNNSATKNAQLECLERYPDTCVGGSNPISFTNVLRAVEDVEAISATNIADGMKQGLEVLGFDPYNEGQSANCEAGGSCGRGAAAGKVMILLTDGIPNRNPGGACAASDWYPDADDPNRVNIRYNGDDDYDCMLWFAEDAHAHGVRIYTIGLGYGVDSEVLREVAERGDGQYYFSVSAEDLDMVFEEIISSTVSSCSPQNLILTKSVTPTEGLQVGDLITYSLSFSNAGDLATTNVVLTDRLPINTQFVTATGSFTPPSPAAGEVITWTIGQLVGGATETQRLTVVISPTQSGNVITNVAGIYGDQTAGQATLAISFMPPTTGESWPIYLPVILKDAEIKAQ